MAHPTYRPDFTVPPELAARGLGRGRLVLGLAGLGAQHQPAHASFQEGMGQRAGAAGRLET